MCQNENFAQRQENKDFDFVDVKQECIQSGKWWAKSSGKIVTFYTATSPEIEQRIAITKLTISH